jgi:hypothetical protein
MKHSQKLVSAAVVTATMLGALLLAKTTESEPAAPRMIATARTFLDSLTPAQRAQAAYGYADPERTNWHYIPRPRKGVSIKDLETPARAAAKDFIASGLSQAGYEQALNVMSLEDVLYLVEGGDWKARRQRRDPLNYFLTVFGEPSDQGLWGWRLEGHHLSLNYSIANGKIVASTPEFFGANPALIEAGPGRSIRVLAAEEDLAREIAKSCTPEQRKTAQIDRHAPDDIKGQASTQPDPSPAVGLAAADMSKDQRALLKQLLGEYLKNMPAEVRAERESKLESAGFDKLKFGWWGSLNRNERHAYRIEGPTFLIEYNNTQNDANHVHSVWRNLAGDFNLPSNAH